MYVILAIAIFGFLIIVHELGHFVAAKALGVKVDEFSICMGPALFQKTVGETTYSLRCIPIGGYCAMEGEDAQSDNPRAFTNAKWWKRLVILIAGSFMNFLTGFVLIALLSNFVLSPSNTTIASFYPDSSVEANGLKVGDAFYSVNGERIYFSSDISMFLDRSLTGTADVVVLRDGKKLAFPNFKVERREYEIDGEPQLLYGITLAQEELTFGRKLHDSWYTCLNFARMVRMGLSDLLTGRAAPSDMGGVVAIVHTMSKTGAEAESTREGLVTFFYFSAFIAVNLAVMNMLPLPALDGGRVFFLLVTVLLETILRKKLNPKYEGYIHAAGMVLLLIFMAYITVHDVWTLIFR